MLSAGEFFVPGSTWVIFAQRIQGRKVLERRCARASARLFDGRIGRLGGTAGWLRGRIEIYRGGQSLRRNSVND